MKRFNKTLATLGTLGAFLFYPLVSNAGIITYSDFENRGGDPVEYTVTVEDDGDNFLVTYSVSGQSENTVAKFTGFFFDFGDITTPLDNGDPDSEDPYASEAELGISEDNPLVCAVALGDVNQVNGAKGCSSTLQLGTTVIDGVDYAGFLFDVGLAWKENDLSNNGSGTFSIAKNGFTLEDWGAVGMRGQETSGDEGSAKEFAIVSTRGGPGDPRSVPEPATVFMFSLCLLGLYLKRKDLFNMS